MFKNTKNDSNQNKIKIKNKKKIVFDLIFQNL